MAGYISLKDAYFLVGPLYHRITGVAKGTNVISITQDEDDTTIVEGALGDATFVMSESRVRTWTTILIPSSQDITVLQNLKATGKPWPFKYEFGVTKLSGLAVMSKDADIVAGDQVDPITLTGKAWVGQKVIGAMGAPVPLP